MKLSCQVFKSLFLVFLFNFLTEDAVYSRPSGDYEESVNSKDRASPVRIYKMESFQLEGTERLTESFLAEELGLVKGTLLNDTFVMDTRQKLLGLGLFRSVLLFMRKGTEPGWAKLVVEVEDDKTVLTSWALGGEIDVTYCASKTSAGAQSSSPLGYRAQIIGRNLANRLHRGLLLIDVSGQGDLAEAQVAYGLPKFAQEKTKFDARMSSVNVTKRYLNAMGFGSRGEAYWSQDAGDFTSIQYGVSMYLNRGQEYLMPGFPTTVAGPRLAFIKETRLMGFLPSAGYNYGAAVLIAPGNTEHSIVELSSSGTIGITDNLWTTLEGRVLTVGDRGVSSRWQARFDIPLETQAKKRGDMAKAFLRLTQGYDRYNADNLAGGSAVLGIRYHSPGLLAEISIKITAMKESLKQTRVGGQ